MKIRIPNSLVAALFAGFATTAVQADSRNVTAGEPSAQPQETKVARFTEKSAQPQTRLQNYGRAGYHVRADYRAQTVPRSSRETTVALMVEKPGHPRMVLQNHGRAGYQYRPARD